MRGADEDKGGVAVPEQGVGPAKGVVSGAGKPDPIGQVASHLQSSKPAIAIRLSPGFRNSGWRWTD